MATLKYLSQYFSTTLNVGGGIDASQTTGIILQSVSGVHDITEPGQICITYSDPIDTSVAEWIDYTSINGSNELVGAVRGREGFSAHTHLQNATVAFVFSASHHNDVVDAVKKVYNETTDTLLKASAAEVATGTDDTKIVTPLAAAPYANSSMARQAIINGNFDVWQRGITGALADSTALFVADHWREIIVKDGGTLPTLTRTKETLASGDIANAFYYTRLTTNGAGTSYGANSQHKIQQKIENGTRFLCGLNKKVTVSFWARSSIANKRLGLVLSQYYGSGGTPSTQEEIITQDPITLTSTWTKYTATFTTNTLVGKTFGTANDDSLQLNFFYIWGTTFGNSSVYPSVTAETHTGSGTIDIAQVQLCAGDVALPFQPKSFEEESRACQRYFCVLNLGANGYIGQLVSESTTKAYGVVPTPATMRIGPALTVSAATDFTISNGALTAVDLNGLTQLYTHPDGVGIEVSVASGLTAGRGGVFKDDGGGNGKIYFNAEL